MSSREWIFRIQDILAAIDKIELYLGKQTLTQFKKNQLVIDAIIRNFEIIGEASKNIPPSIKRSYPGIPWKEMNGMRNILIHEYFGVDVKTIWHTAKYHLPDLRVQLENIPLEMKKKSHK